MCITIIIIINIIIIITIKIIIIVTIIITIIITIITRGSPSLLLLWGASDSCLLSSRSRGLR